MNSYKILSICVFTLGIFNNLRSADHRGAFKRPESDVFLVDEYSQREAKHRRTEPVDQIVPRSPSPQQLEQIARLEQEFRNAALSIRNPNYPACCIIARDARRFGLTLQQLNIASVPGLFGSPDISVAESIAAAEALLKRYCNSTPPRVTQGQMAAASQRATQAIYELAALEDLERSQQ